MFYVIGVVIVVSVAGVLGFALISRARKRLSSLFSRGSSAADD